MDVRFNLNGEDVEIDVNPVADLLDTLRSTGNTGVKEGCGVGVCGACTVLVDDRPVSSCIYATGAVDGHTVWTVEGLAERFPRVVDAFVHHEGMQCGICTPGQVVSVCALALSGQERDEEGVRRFLNGNICRCTGYGTVIEAAMAGLDDD